MDTHTFKSPLTYLNPKDFSCNLHKYSFHISSKFSLSGRTDLKYLQQFTEWFQRTFSVIEKTVSRATPLESTLAAQMENKQATSNKMLAYIFICVLRAMGIHCRLVLSFRVLPLRPVTEELCSLSTKENPEKPTCSKKKTNLEILKAGQVESGVGVCAETDGIKIEKISNSKGSKERPVDLKKLKVKSTKNVMNVKAGHSKNENDLKKATNSSRRGTSKKEDVPKTELKSKEKVKIEKTKEKKKSANEKEQKDVKSGKGPNLGKLRSCSVSTESVKSYHLLRSSAKEDARSRSVEKDSCNPKKSVAKPKMKAKKKVVKVKPPDIHVNQVDGE